MLGQSTIAIAAATIAIGTWLPMIPAHCQSPNDLSWLDRRPDPETVNLYRDMSIKAAKEAGSR
jgi:hypothetical protein